MWQPYVYVLPTCVCCYGVLHWKRRSVLALCFCCFEVATGQHIGMVTIWCPHVLLYVWLYVCVYFCLFTGWFHCQSVCCNFLYVGVYLSGHSIAMSISNIARATLLLCDTISIKWFVCLIAFKLWMYLHTR